MSRKERRKKRTARKIHNGIIYAINTIMGIIALLSIAFMDSDSWLPCIALFISVGWFWLFIWANDEPGGGNG